MDFFFKVTISFILKFQKTSREGTDFLTLMMTGSKCERLRNPTNVSASAGGRLPTPTSPCKECRKGELASPFLLFS